jgi:hypothetical protein
MVLLPTLDIPGLKQVYASYTPLGNHNYCSNELLMSKAEIKKLLVKGGFLS